MIKKIHLKNFRCHVDKVIEFDSPIHVIVGASDTGKSCIIRALQWVLTNRPLGSDYVKWGQTSCSVDVYTDKGVVNHTRNGKQSTYSVNGLDLTHTGSQVPEQVLDVLGVEEINIQSQLEPPYMLMDSGGEVAKRIAKFADLEQGLRVVSAVKQDVRRLTSKVDVLQEQHSKLESAIIKYQSLDDIKPLVEQHEKQERILETFTERHLELHEMIGEIDRIGIQQSILSKAFSYTGDIQSLEAMNVEYRADLEAQRRLQRQVSAIQLCNSFVSNKGLIFSQESHFSRYNKHEIEYKEATSNAKHLSSLIKSYQGLEATLSGMKSAISSLEEKMTICPTCQRPLP